MGFLTFPNVSHPTPPISYIWGGEFGEHDRPISPHFGEFGVLCCRPSSGAKGGEA